jgi:hypothetical protein
MAMKRAVDQLGPMALAVVSLAIIIGIGAIVLAELGSLSVVTNSTTADSTIQAGQDALGTFGDFFTVIVVNQPPIATQEHYMLETPVKAIDRKGNRMGQSAGNPNDVGSSEAIRAPSTLVNVDEDFVQIATKSSDGLNSSSRRCGCDLPPIGSSKTCRWKQHGVKTHA